jgi:hypothetical protein
MTDVRSFDTMLANKPLSRDDVEEAVVEDEVFIYDSVNEASVYRLNSGAAIIWYLCDGTRNLTEMAQEIVAGFDLDEAEVLENVKNTVDYFHQLGLLVAHNQ